MAPPESRHSERGPVSGISCRVLRPFDMSISQQMCWEQGASTFHVAVDEVLTC